MIPFTQYLTNGRTWRRAPGSREPERKREGAFDRPPEIEAIAKKLIDAGARFEVEMLGDYSTISITCELPVNSRNGDDVMLANGLVANGPEVPEAVDRVVRDAEKAMAECLKK